MRQPIRLRFDAAIANTPIWLAAATALATLLLVGAASQLRSAGLASDGADWRALPERAMQVAAAIEQHGAADPEAMSAWLDTVRRESNGQIAWLRLLDSAGATEARSGAAVARVQWDSDDRIRAGQRSYRVVKTPGGMVAVAAAPLAIPDRRHSRLVSYASLGRPIEQAKLLEIGAPLSGAKTAASAAQWVNLLVSGLLTGLLLIALTRRALLLD